MIKFETENSSPLDEGGDSPEQRRVVRRLLVLHQLSLTLQTQIDEASLLHIMLSGITAGEALGFNRALVFLLDDSRTCLEGKLGVGPINEEECRHIWQSIADRNLTIDDFLGQFETLKKYQTAELHVKTRAIRQPVAETDDLFNRVLSDRTCYHVHSEEDLRRVPEGVRELLDTRELAIAPLAVTGESLGVVIADNKFSGRPITGEDIQLLCIVASQTAAVLAHLRMVERLEEFHGMLEEKVREAVAEKEQAQGEMVRHAKLATVGEMAVTIAHEIRNPLTSVRGFAQRLHRKRSDAETVETYSEIIIQEVDRLNHVLGDVLDFAGNVDALFGPVNLNETVEKAVVLLSERLGQKNILCETSLDPDMPICHYDETQLSQLIINLMKNGAEAMGQGGVLVVNTRAEEEACVVEVVDTGCGIPREELDHIFEPFFTTKTKGTGLGLAFAKRVIEEHGGKIEAESEVGEGTVFRVLLPIRRDAPKMGDLIENIGSADPMVDREDPLATPGNRD